MEAKLTFAVALVLLGTSSIATAQSLVVSVPSTDVTPTGATMVAHESQVNTWSQDKVYWNSYTFGTHGLAKNIELAATLFGVSRPGSGNVALGVGYKHKTLLAAGPWEPTIAVGQMLPISFSGKGVGTWTYGVGSFRLPKLETRFTAGLSYGTEQIFGYRTFHSFYAVEQPLNKHVSLIGDWFSGKHDLGALVVGGQWNVSKAFIVIAGYKIPNTPRGGVRSVIVELTYEFGLH